MNIKPFRDYDEHDVIGLYALNTATGRKGVFVSPSTFNPTNYQGYTNIPVGTSADGTWSVRYAVNARVTASASGAQNVLGMQLYDVLENDENGIPIRFSPKYVKDAKAVVCSGEAVPILTRGIVEIWGFWGTPGPGSGAFISNSGDGSLVVGLPDRTTTAPNSQKVGTFLSSTGYDGYAILEVRL